MNFCESVLINSLYTDIFLECWSSDVWRPVYWLILVDFSDGFSASILKIVTIQIKFFEYFKDGGKKPLRKVGK